MFLLVPERAQLDPEARASASVHEPPPSTLGDGSSGTRLPASGTASGGRQYNAANGHRTDASSRPRKDSLLGFTRTPDRDPDWRPSGHKNTHLRWWTVNPLSCRISTVFDAGANVPVTGAARVGNIPRIPCLPLWKAGTRRHVIRASLRWRSCDAPSGRMEAVRQSDQAIVTTHADRSNGATNSWDQCSAIPSPKDRIYDRTRPNNIPDVSA